MNPSQIICIDDDEVFSFILKLAFKDLIKDSDQIEVNFYNQPQVVLEELKASTLSPNLIFLDLNMQGMNGFEFLDEYIESGYKDAFPNCKICILTSSISKQDKTKAEQYSFIHDFLQKPLNKAELESMINLI